MTVLIRDHLLRGFAAGVLAGAVMAVIDQVSVFLGISTLAYSQWAAVYTLGYLPNNFLEGMVGHVGHLMFAGFNGLLFAWIVPHEKHAVIKGIYKTELLLPKAVGTAMTDFLTAIIYGWVLAVSNGRWSKDA